MVVNYRCSLRIRQNKEQFMTKKPGTYWMVNTRGEVNKAPRVGGKYKLRQAFGNCFLSHAKAKDARDRMRRLFRRIKDGS